MGHSPGFLEILTDNKGVHKKSKNCTRIHTPYVLVIAVDRSSIQMHRQEKERVKPHNLFHNTSSKYYEGRLLWSGEEKLEREGETLDVTA
jgi:hypothetical protein